PFLVMQYCSFGNICHYLKFHRPDANRVDLVYDIVAGMTYLHGPGRNIVHADLKGVNILIDDKCHALIADFGLSRSSAMDVIRSRTALSTQRGGIPPGTLRWMAPECLRGEKPTKASDIYSLGITIWEARNSFFCIKSYVVHWEHLIFNHVVTEGNRPPRPVLLHYDPLWELVQKCWDALPSSRPSIREVQ
ncbi:kinase-like domain-containing protein, partial [Vararia minispora EC-137]